MSFLSGGDKSTPWNCPPRLTEFNFQEVSTHFTVT
jgi:hypothetical protein